MIYAKRQDWGIFSWGTGIIERNMQFCIFEGWFCVDVFALKGLFTIEKTIHN